MSSPLAIGVRLDCISVSSSEFVFCLHILEMDDLLLYRCNVVLVGLYYIFQCLPTRVRPVSFIESCLEFGRNVWLCFHDGPLCRLKRRSLKRQFLVGWATATFRLRALRLPPMMQRRPLSAGNASNDCRSARSRWSVVTWPSVEVTLVPSIVTSISIQQPHPRPYTLNVTQPQEQFCDQSV